ncbi:MAG TPA: oligopeptide/dipeptide ABC transporter ATP-binding protein, partial [Actinomycetota bacterium]
DEFGLAMILITHDLSVLAETCDRVAIMYGGQFAEIGSVEELYRTPQHPYTHRLLGAFPAIGGPRELAPPIPGVPPDASALPSGCRFEPRCHMRADRCTTEQPSLTPLGEGHAARCFFVPWEPGALDRPVEGLPDAGAPQDDRPEGPGDDAPTWAEIPGGMAMPLPDETTGDPQ